MEDTFATLIAAEMEQLGRGEAAARVGSGGPTETPFVVDAPRNLFGLALSGGGYIGGWWTARRRAQGENRAPIADDPLDPEVRHLREFSRFLVPRVGLTEVETGYFVVGALSAIVPSLIGAAAVMILGLFAFCGGVSLFVDPSAGRAFWALLGVTLLAHAALEAAGRRSGKAEPRDRHGRFFAFAALAASLSIGASSPRPPRGSLRSRS